MRRALSPSQHWVSQFLASRPQYEWRQDGTFSDIDGASVRAYDDVVLLDDIDIEDGDGKLHTIPSGTVATVLFFQAELDGLADLECEWPEDGFSFGFAPTNRLRFHMSNEAKYSKGRRSS